MLLLRFLLLETVADGIDLNKIKANAKVKIYDLNLIEIGLQTFYWNTMNEIVFFFLSSLHGV